MYLPPAATWEVGGARWQRRLVVLLLALSATLCAAFCLSQQWGAPSLVLLLVLVLCMAGVWWGLQQAAKGTLHWDGAHWHWTDTQHKAVTHVIVIFDWQHLLLLRIECCDGKLLWLWLESRAMDLAWLSMRRALVASQHPLAPLQPNSLPGRNAQ